MSRDTALRHHLKYNHYPPISPKIIPYAHIAMERAEAGDWDTEITIRGDHDSMTVTVNKLISDLHLHEFLSCEHGVSPGDDCPECIEEYA